MTIPLLPLLIALVDWIAVAKNWRRLEYVAKPTTMLALLAWMGLTAPDAITRAPLVWFALAIVFALIGDVMLMLPREQFIAGLVAFLLAHLAYLVGFNQALPPLNISSFVFVAAVALGAWRLHRSIAAGLTKSGATKLQMPVMVYSIVIALMLLSAWLTLLRAEWHLTAALMVSLGALLFFASDATLAWNRFVSALRFGRLIVIVTYHLGQMLLIAGAVLQFAA